MVQGPMQAVKLKACGNENVFNWTARLSSPSVSTKKTRGIKAFKTRLLTRLAYIGDYLKFLL